MVLGSSYGYRQRKFVRLAKRPRKGRLPMMVSSGYGRKIYPQLLSKTKDLQVFDTVGITGGVGTTMVYTDIFHPVTGTGYADRYGDKCTLVSLNFNFKIIGVETAAVNYIRVMLIFDKQPNGGLPTSPQPLVSTNVSAFKNPDFSHRFTILRSWRIECHSGAAANPTVDEPFTEGYFKLGNRMVVFQASTGAVTDFSSGALYMAAISNDNTNKPLIQYGFRVSFIS